MGRIVMMVLRNIFLVPIMWFKLCYYAAHVEKYTEEQRYEMLRFIDHRAVKGGNVRIDVYGAENIPKENGFMFFLIIRDCLMCLQLWKRVRFRFPLYLKKKWQMFRF